MKRLIVCLSVVLMISVCFSFVSCDYRSPENDEDGTSIGDNKEEVNNDTNDDGNDDTNDDGNDDTNDSGNDDTNDSGNDDINDNYIYPWKKTPIIFESATAYNNHEFSSSAKSYYAGENTTGFASIDADIKKRNEEAMSAANVTVEYTYIEDARNYNAGKNSTRIILKIASGDSDTPDIFSCFEIDMVLVAFRGYFANMLDNNYSLGNHFSFANNEQPSYDGYYYEYMQNLTLDPENKIFCLVSDYNTDFVRSFSVIPVNIDMFNSIDKTKISEVIGGDRNSDGAIDILDLYELVLNGEWTYDVFASLCSAVYKDTEGSPSGDDITDRLGFCLGDYSDTMASALIFSSSVSFVEKDYRGKYAYPAKNNELFDLFVAINDLIDQPGILSEYRSTFSSVLGCDISLEIIGVRNIFAKNTLLFGGIDYLGSLENDIYKNMESKDGIGILPIPVYKKGDNYLTYVEGIAPVIAISYTTNNFSQCSLFLDYLSKNSSEIVNKYYENNILPSEELLSCETSLRMFNLIRDRAVGSISKTTERLAFDYMRNDPFYNNYNNRYLYWPISLSNNRYKFISVKAHYDSIIADKYLILKNINKDWDNIESIQEKMDKLKESWAN